MRGSETVVATSRAVDACRGCTRRPHLTVLSHEEVTTQPISCTQKMFLIGWSCAATCVAWLVARSQILAVLSQLPVYTLEPSLAHEAHRIGPSCEIAAFGTALPFCCISQQRIWLSHDPAARWLATGDQATHEIPSVAAFCTSASADSHVASCAVKTRENLRRRGCRVGCGSSALLGVGT